MPSVAVQTPEVWGRNSRPQNDHTRAETAWIAGRRTPPRTNPTTGQAEASSACGRTGAPRRDVRRRSGRLRPDASRRPSPSWTRNARPKMDVPGGALLAQARRSRAPLSPMGAFGIPQCTETFEYAVIFTRCDVWALSDSLAPRGTSGPSPAALRAAASPRYAGRGNAKDRLRRRSGR